MEKRIKVNCTGSTYITIKEGNQNNELIELIEKIKELDSGDVHDLIWEIEDLDDLKERPHSKRIAGSLPNPTIKFKYLLENFAKYKNEDGKIAIGIESLEQFRILSSQLEKNGYIVEKLFKENIAMERSLIGSWKSNCISFIIFENVINDNQYYHVDGDESEENDVIWFFELIFDDINE